MNTVSNNKIAINVTVDDFDSPIIMTSEKWSTPDPSNKTSLASASMYFGRTYHRTNVSNELKFRFNGTRPLSPFLLPKPLYLDIDYFESIT
jgi:hypothetical protein